MSIYYQKEIDGLRAISVLGVIFYHANINIFPSNILPGGYLGVDVFFAISGYLITAILLRDLKYKNKNFFKNFYIRRIRRILPALLFLLIVLFIFSWISLLPNDLAKLSKSIVSSLFFISNYFFYFSGFEYSNYINNLNPFLHSWSLSVEEQYYLFFPLFLYALYKIKNYFFIIILLFICSLSLSQYLSVNSPSFNFYFTLSRVWELFAGSILAIYRHKKKLCQITFFKANIYSFFGLMLILLSFILLDRVDSNPSLLTTLPIIGTLLIINFSKENTITYKILSRKYLTYMGLISYSLYLWHYPIFVIDDLYNYSNNSIFKSIQIFLILFFISAFSFHFIERPFRQKISQKNSLIIIIIIFFSVILIYSYAYFKNGFENRSHLPEYLKNMQNMYFRNITQNEIDCHNRTGENGFCIFNELNNNVGDIILLGDSLTDALLKSFIEETRKTKFRLITMSYSGMMFIPNTLLYQISSKKIISESNKHEFRLKFINQKIHKNTYIVVLGKYPKYFEEKGLILSADGKNIENYDSDYILTKISDINLKRESRYEIIQKSFFNTINDLSKNNKILLVEPLIESPVETHRYLFSKINDDKTLGTINFYKNDIINYSRELYFNHNYKTLELFNKFKNKNIHKIKLVDIFCPEENCLMYDDKNIYIWDAVHPTYIASQKINEVIFNKINELEYKK